MGALALAEGTFGRVSVGWTRYGLGIAIKRFKNLKSCRMLLWRFVTYLIGPDGDRNWENLLDPVELGGMYRLLW